MDCELSLVTPPPLAISARFSSQRGEVELQRGSLVRSANFPREHCGGAPIEVLSTAGWYTVPAPATPGDFGCFGGTLTPVLDQQFVVLTATPSLAAGTLLPALTACDAAGYHFGATLVPAPELAGLRAISAENLARVETVRAAYTERVGPIGRHQLPWADEGFVGLPLPHVYTEAEVAAEAQQEHLDTPARREKALVADSPIYAHFWGADAPWSDVWARPETVISVLRTAAGWYVACTTGGGTADQCRLQIGDLAWYNDAKPDPLGHKDHREGRCVDLRLLRSDGAHYEAWWNRPDDRTGRPAYDAARTLQLLDWTARNVGVREGFFNDPTALAALPWLRPLPGHDDHVHVCFAGAP